MLNSRAILLSLTLIVVFGNRHQTNSAYFDSQNPPGRYVYSVAWSPDGSKIAVGRGGFECTGSDNAIHIIEPSTKKTLTILEGHTCEVSSLSWSPDGDHLASASPDGTVRIWDVADGHLIATSDVIDRGRLFVAWSPDGKRLATIALAETGVELLDSSTGQSLGYLCCHPGGAFTAAWNPDGSQLASAGRDKNIQLWDVASQQNVATYLAHDDIITSLAWSPDGSEIASGGGGNDTSIRVWNASTESSVFVLQSHTAAVTSLKWSSAGTRLASASLDGTVQVWDIINGQRIAVIDSPGDAPLYTVDWSPDDSRLVYGGEFDMNGLDAFEIVDASAFLPTPTDIPSEIGG